MKNIAKQLKKSKSVAIFGHISPDPDCMGSMSALGEILKQKGINVRLFLDTNKEPEAYELFNFNKNYNEDINVEEFDTLISVDVATRRLLGKYGDAFINFKNTIAIDHHGSRDLNAGHIYNEPHSSSCSEVIFKLAKHLKAQITPQIASYLFAGIVGDTACFQHDNVTESTHAVAGELYKYGADAKKIIFLEIKRKTAADIKLTKFVYENMVNKDNIAYMIFTKKLMDEAGTDNTKPYVNEMLNIEDNIFAFAISQKEKNTYSVSIRCKNGYDACKIAEKYGGGGHKQAAGLSFTGAPFKHAKMLYNDCLEQIKQKRN